MRRNIHLVPITGLLLLCALGCTSNSDPSGMPASVGCSVPPTVPAGLSSPGQTSSSIDLSWNASVTGAHCTAQYRVYQDGTLVAQVSGTSTTINGLAAITTYSFAVAAVNAFSSSAKSDAISVKTRGDVLNPKLEIRTWVPPYSQSVWKSALTADTGGAYKPSNTLTTVASQFFQIKTDGTVFLAGATESDLQWVSSYCRTNGIKFLVCVTDYNSDPAVNDFDWTIAASAFDTNKSTLIDNIVSLVDTWSADGVNIDFEGNVGSETRPAFAVFIRDLGTRLHASGKELTVAVFPYIWNAPAIDWVGDWVGDVDGVDSMGYDSLYGGPGPEVWNAYKWQQDTVLAQGYEYYQFDMGLPGWLGTWGQGGLGTSVLDHLNELQSGAYNTKPTSICIWDAQFSGSGWMSPEVWAALHSIRTAPEP